MSLNEFLDELSGRGVSLMVDGEQLRIRARQGVLTPMLRDKIAARKNELIELLKGIGGGASEPAPQSIEPDPDSRYRPFPLTDIQHAYWIGRGDSIVLGNVAVHAYIEIEHDGLDIDGLNRAWTALVRRHDMLRMVILPSGEQRIIESVPEYRFDVMDLRHQAEDVILENLEGIRQSMSHQILPTERWPLFDIRATRYGHDAVRLHISLDILMADLWSLFRLFSEWRKLYDDPDAEMAPLALSFRDYVLAEQSLETTALYQTARRYWLERLDRIHPAPELPLARHPTSIARPRFTRRSYELDADAWKNLTRRAGKAGVTPSGVLLAAFAEVLALWSKNPRFTLNLTLFNRMPLHPQVNLLVGDFTTTILLAIERVAASGFDERARRVQQQLYADLDHRVFNGVRVLREMAQRSNGAPTAAMPVVFSSALGLGSLDEDSEVVMQLGGQLGDVKYTITQTPQVWLDHQVFEIGGALCFNWDVVEDLFPHGMIDSMFDAYCELLRSLADDPGAWRTSEPVTLPRSQQAQRAKVNATQCETASSLLHELILRQAERTPDAEAVVAEGRRLTYSELASEGRRLARQLRALDVRPNVLTAVVLDKGWEQVVGVVGILAAGGAYLPIDPGLPEARRNFLLAHGEVDVIVTSKALECALAWPEGVTCVCIDDPALQALSADPLDSAQAPHDLAYVIYTSGSTGEPKGVMIEHAAVVNTITDINRRYHVGREDKVLAVSALGFDLSVYDIFGLLAVGGTVVIPTADDSKDAAHWWTLIGRERVTMWNSVPALFQMLVEYISGSGKSGRCSLRLALLSGDWIPLELPNRARAIWNDLEIISQGGATEASIWSISYPIAAVDPVWRSVPYGKPLANQSFHVLGEALEVRPDWAVGQLYIGGVGLARGYWHDEEKTRNSFITHPVTGERIYKTGDLGRYLPDGDIEFLGREDFQVKVNGYRIELGEIEAVLNQHPRIREAVVAAVGERLGDKRLVAYVVPADTGKHPAQKHPAQPPHDLDPLDRFEFKLRQAGLRADRDQGRHLPFERATQDAAAMRLHLARQSYRNFLQQTIGMDVFGRLFSVLSQLQVAGAPLPKYRYPSAGSLYPVQTYAVVKSGRVEGLDAGVYYYDPSEHELIFLNALDSSLGDTFAGIAQPVARKAAFAIFSISKPAAIEPLYGELSRDFCLLEAGYMGQILMEAAPANGLGLCSIGKVDFIDPLRSLFDLEDDQELLQAFVGGAVAAEDGRRWWSHADPEPLEPQLRRYLGERLPAYMVPSTFVPMEHLPLTANGKVDRNGLPELTQSAECAPASVQPRTDVERRMVDLFVTVLKLESVGIHDSFFELGGDSLQGTRLVATICNTFGVDLQLRELFQGPTVAELAARITERSAVIGHVPATAAGEHEEEGEL